MSRYGNDEAPPMAEGPGVETKATVKWFNLIKGFGFVAPADGSQDAFLHVSVVNRAGRQKVEEGQELRVTLGRGQRGPQVMDIVEFLSEGQGGGGGGGGGGRRQEGGFQGRPQFQRPQASGPEAEVTGAVKWFRPEKGFGFLQADDGDRDIFLHVSVLRDAGVMNIQPGQKVRARYRSSQKGREATAIEILPGMVDVSQFN